MKNTKFSYGEKCFCKWKKFKKKKRIGVHFVHGRTGTNVWHVFEHEKKSYEKTFSLVSWINTKRKNKFSHKMFGFACFHTWKNRLKKSFKRMVLGCNVKTKQTKNVFQTWKNKTIFLFPFGLRLYGCTGKMFGMFSHVKRIFWQNFSMVS